MAVLDTSSTILSSPLFINGILPFLLVFVLVFAVLQKSKILGNESKQMSAIIAIVIGLITVSFSYYTNIIVSMIPILAVGLVIILIFLMLWSFVYGNEGFTVAPWVKAVFGALAFLTVLISGLIITGAWVFFKNFFSGQSDLLTNIVFIIIVAIAIAVVVGVSGKDGKPSHG